MNSACWRQVYILDVRTEVNSQGIQSIQAVVQKVLLIKTLIVSQLVLLHCGRFIPQCIPNIEQSKFSQNLIRQEVSLFVHPLYWHCTPSQDLLYTAFGGENTVLDIDANALEVKMFHLLLFAEFLSVPVSTECNVANNSKTTEDRLLYRD